MPDLRSLASATRILCKTTYVAGFVVLMSACGTTPTEQNTNDELIEVRVDNFDEAYRVATPDLPRVTRVAIAPPEVQMSEQWLREFRGDYTSRDLERISSDYGRFLQESFQEALTQAGVEVVAPDASPQIVIVPKLRNLDIYAPDLTPLAFTDQYIETAGNATLELSIQDPESSRILAQLTDHREAPAIVVGRIAETNRAVNNRLFTRLMDQWSRNFIDYLKQTGGLAESR